MNAQHTPTPELNFEKPLRIEHDDALGTYSLRDYTGSIIARIKADDSELPALIVRAVNCHEELLEAAKQFVNRHGQVPKVEAGGICVCGDCARFKEAIAKAEGK